MHDGVITLYRNSRMKRMQPTFPTRLKEILSNEKLLIEMPQSLDSF